MQKKLIALAVAGLLSAPAFAQSNVTLYGTLDYGYAWLGRDAGAPGVRTGNRHAIESGVSKANRLGFKGVEDLGNGLKAVFVLEAGLNGEQGGVWKAGSARQSYGALAGGFGTVAFGRHYTPQHLFTSAVDPFGKNGLGSAGNVLVQDKRLDNLAAYISPNWGGFSFILGYTWNGIGNENHDDSMLGGVRVWAVAPSFTWNNLFVAANYHQAQLNVRGGGDDLDVFYVVDLYAAYDFGPVKLGGTVGQRVYNSDVTAAGTGDYKITQAMLGVTWKITSNDALLLSGAYAQDDYAKKNGGKRKVSQLAIGYEHSLTKRTALYAQFAHQFQNKSYRNNDGFAGTNGVGINGALTADGVNQTGVGASNLGSDTARFRQGFAVGFRHDF